MVKRGPKGPLASVVTKLTSYGGNTDCKLGTIEKNSANFETAFFFGSCLEEPLRIFSPGQSRLHSLCVVLRRSSSLPPLSLALGESTKVFRIQKVTRTSAVFFPMRLAPSRKMKLMNLKGGKTKNFTSKGQFI